MPPQRRTILRLRRHRRRSASPASPYPTLPPSENIQPTPHLDTSTSSNARRPSAVGYFQSIDCLVSGGPRPAIWVRIPIPVDNHGDDEPTMPLVEERTVRVQVEVERVPSGPGDGDSMEERVVTIRRDEETSVRPIPVPPVDDHDHEEVSFEEERLKAMMIQRDLERRVVVMDTDIDDDEDREVCAICLDELRDDDEGKEIMKIVRLDCRHEYHLDCIKDWVMMKNSCPVCKGLALPALS